MKRKEYKEIVVSETDLLSTLGKSYLCRGVSQAEIKTISPFFLTLKVNAGAVIYDEGDQESFLCLIAAGNVNVVKGLGSLSNQIITTLGPGESIGELSVIDQQPRSASVVANSDAVLFSLTGNNLIEMYNTQQAIWSKFIFNIAVLLATRLRTTTNLLAENMASNTGAQSGQYPKPFFQQEQL